MSGAQTQTLPPRCCADTKSAGRARARGEAEGRPSGGYSAEKAEELTAFEAALSSLKVT